MPCVNLISAQVHARSVSPVLQSGVSQFQGGRLCLQIRIQTVDVALHFYHFIFSLQTDTDSTDCVFDFKMAWPVVKKRKTWNYSISNQVSHVFYLPLQLITGLLFMVIALTNGKLCGPPLSFQVILQLRIRGQRKYHCKCVISDTADIRN